MSAATLLTFAMWLPMFCIPPIEHILREELLLTHTQTGLLYSAPILMVAAMAIPGGIAADHIGVRKAAGIGAIIIALASILRSTATSPTSLLAFTFVYGIGLGWTFPNLPKLVSLWVPRQKAGVATGIYSLGLYVGPALAVAITIPLIFPITNTFQGVFLIWSIPAIVAATLWWILVREPPYDSSDNEQLSKPKTLLLSVTKNKNLWLISAIALLHAFFYYNWTAWAPALLMIKGATPSLAGLIASITMWVGIPVVFLIPKLSDSLGLRKPFLWVSGIVLAVAAWLAIQVALPMSWLPMVLVGVADCALLVTTLTLPIEMMSRKEIGTATGLILSIGHAGGVIGPLVGGRVLDLTGSLDSSLLVLIGVSVAMVIIPFKLPETGPKARTNHQLVHRKRA